MHYFRFEGRNWYTPVRGRLWICSGKKEPDQELIDSLKKTYSYIVEGNDFTILYFMM